MRREPGVRQAIPAALSGASGWEKTCSRFSNHGSTGADRDASEGSGGSRGVSIGGAVAPDSVSALSPACGRGSCSSRPGQPDASRRGGERERRGQADDGGRPPVVDGCSRGRVDGVPEPDIVDQAALQPNRAREATRRPGAVSVADERDGGGAARREDQGRGNGCRRSLAAPRTAAVGRGASSLADAGLPCRRAPRPGVAAGRGRRPSTLVRRRGVEVLYFRATALLPTIPGKWVRIPHGPATVSGERAARGRRWAPVTVLGAANAPRELRASETPRATGKVAPAWEDLAVPR